MHDNQAHGTGPVCYWPKPRAAYIIGTIHIDNYFKSIWYSILCNLYFRSNTLKLALVTIDVTETVVSKTMRMIQNKIQHLYTSIRESMSAKNRSTSPFYKDRRFL